MKIRLSQLKRIIREEVSRLTESAPAVGVTVQKSENPKNVLLLTADESRLWRVDPKNSKSPGLTAAAINAQMGAKRSMSLEDFSDDVQVAVRAMWDSLSPIPREEGGPPEPAHYDLGRELRRDYDPSRHDVTDQYGNPIPGAYSKPTKWREPRRMWGRGI